MEVKSIVTEIGEMAFFEGEPVLILFSPSAPDELKEVCVIHDFTIPPAQETFRVGSKIYFGDQEYTVKQLGSAANKTFYELGHISLYFDWSDSEEVLQGAASLSPQQVPQVSVGDTLRFVF